MKYFEIELVCHKCSTLNKVELEDTSKISAQCKSCSYKLFVATPVNGFIYVLSNPHMPDLLKIGFTSRAVEQRIDELSSSTGVPSPFECEAVFPSAHPEKDEKAVHLLFDAYRVNNKEFFKIEAVIAASMISEKLEVEPFQGKKPILDMFNCSRLETVEKKRKSRQEHRKKETAKEVFERTSKELRDQELHEKLDDEFGAYEDKFRQRQKLRPLRKNKFKHD